MKSLFDYLDYRKYVKDELDSPRFGRGGRTELAHKLGVEISFISRVLAGKGEFAPEHILKLAQLFQHGETGKRYLMLLLLYSRAGSEDVREHFMTQIKKIREAQNKIKTKVSQKSELSESDLMRIFGGWQHVVVQMAVRNPKLRTVDAISKYLRITSESVRSSLTLLEQLGFVKATKDQWLPTDARLHFSNYPSLLRANHTNLRSMAVRAYDESTPMDINYSLVLSADSDAIEKIGALILSLIEKAEPIISAAKDEQVVALCLDFFKVGSFD